MVFCVYNPFPGFAHHKYFFHISGFIMCEIVHNPTPFFLPLVVHCLRIRIHTWLQLQNCFCAVMSYLWPQWSTGQSGKATLATNGVEWGAHSIQFKLPAGISSGWDVIAPEGTVSHAWGMYSYVSVALSWCPLWWCPWLCQNWCWVPSTSSHTHLPPPSTAAPLVPFQKLLLD